MPAHHQAESMCAHVLDSQMSIIDVGTALFCGIIFLPRQLLHLPCTIMLTNPALLSGHSAHRIRTNNCTYTQVEHWLPSSGNCV